MWFCQVLKTGAQGASRLSALSIFPMHLWPVSLDVNPACQGKIGSSDHTWKRLFSALKNNGKMLRVQQSNLEWCFHMALTVMKGCDRAHWNGGLCPVQDHFQSQILEILTKWCFIVLVFSTPTISCPPPAFMNLQELLEIQKYKYF